MTRIRVRALVTVAVILGLTSADTRVVGQGRTIGAFFDDFSAEWMRRRPGQTTATRYFTGAEQDRLDRQLTPETAEWRRDAVEQARRGLRELATFDRSRMTDAERVSADVMRWQLQIVVDGEPFSDYDFPLDQFDGANVRIPNLMTVVHPVRTEQDARNYVARVREIDDRLAEATEEAARLAAKGIRPPRFILRSTIAQMQEFVGSPAGQNPLVATFVERMNGVQALTPATRQQLAGDATKVVDSEVYPAWRKAIALLESQLAMASDDAGLWRYKDGAAIYAHKLKQFTTTTMTAAEIHALGLREVSRIEGEMDAILRKLGRTTGTVKARMEKLQSDLSYPITLRSAPEGTRHRAAISPVPLAERRRQLHCAADRWFAAGHLPDAAATREHDESQPADARLSRDHPWPSLPLRLRRREPAAPEISAGARARRHLRHR